MDDDGPTLHPVLFQVILRVSDVALLLVVWIVFQAFFAPSYFRPMFDPPAVSIAGVSIDHVVLWLGFSGVLIGWLWIRRIARGEPEPESNDRFWRSRS